MARYLSEMGWDRRYIWGREVRGGSGGALAHAGLEEKASLTAWQQRGVRRQDGRALPAVDIQASLISMDDGEGPTYLIYDNFRVLMRWNKSRYFATSVGLLSDALRAGR